MIYDQADEVIGELFESLLYRYQIKMKTLMEGSNFIFDCINLFHNKCDRINLNGSGLDIDPLSWIKTKKQQKFL